MAKTKTIEGLEDEIQVLQEKLKTDMIANLKAIQTTIGKPDFIYKKADGTKSESDINVTLAFKNAITNLENGKLNIFEKDGTPKDTITILKNSNKDAATLIDQYITLKKAIEKSADKFKLKKTIKQLSQTKKLLQNEFKAVPEDKILEIKEAVRGLKNNIDGKEEEMTKLLENIKTSDRKLVEHTSDKTKIEQKIETENKKIEEILKKIKIEAEKNEKALMKITKLAVAESKPTENKSIFNKWTSNLEKLTTKTQKKGEIKQEEKSEDVLTDLMKIKNTLAKELAEHMSDKEKIEKDVISINQQIGEGCNEIEKLNLELFSAGNELNRNRQYLENIETLKPKNTPASTKAIIPSKSKRHSKVAPLQSTQTKPDVPAAYNKPALPSHSPPQTPTTNQDHHGPSKPAPRRPPQR